MLRDPQRAEVIYTRWRNTAAQKLIRAFQLLKKIERETYKENSYFLWQDTHGVEAIPSRDPDPAPTWDQATYKEYCE